MLQHVVHNNFLISNFHKDGDDNQDTSSIFLEKKDGRTCKTAIPQSKPWKATPTLR